jgi:hypothetical protein
MTPRPPSRPLSLVLRVAGLVLVLLVACATAEGSAGGILGFRCRFALANADPATPANVVLRFLKSDGTSTAQYVQVPPSSRRTVDADTLAALADSAFSTVVESDGSSWPTAR